MSNKNWDLQERPLDPPEPSISVAAFNSMRREMANDIMGDISETNLNAAWDAVTDDNDVFYALAEFIKDYDDSEKLTMRDITYNHTLACDVIQAIRAYVEKSIPEGEVVDAIRC